MSGWLDIYLSFSSKLTPKTEIYGMVTNLMEKSCEKGQIRMKLPCLT